MRNKTIDLNTQNKNELRNFFVPREADGLIRNIHNNKNGKTFQKRFRIF